MMQRQHHMIGLLLLVAMLPSTRCKHAKPMRYRALPETVTISGRVTDADGNPVEGVEVRATPTDTDGDGDFDLADFARLQVHDPEGWPWAREFMLGPGVPWRSNHDFR